MTYETIREQARNRRRYAVSNSEDEVDNLESNAIGKCRPLLTPEQTEEYPRVWKELYEKYKEKEELKMSDNPNLEEDPIEDMPDTTKFGWLVISIILLDMVMFTVYVNVTAPLCITLLQILFLNYLSEIWRVWQWKNFLEK